jgi:hypothetical protein
MAKTTTASVSLHASALSSLRGCAKLVGRMRRVHRCRNLVGVLVVVVAWGATSLLALTARAEERKPVPRISLGGGYAFVRLIERDWRDENLPRGFWIFASARLARSVELTGEYTHTTKSYDRGISALFFAPQFEIDTLTFGPTLRFRSGRRWSPYVQTLAGVYRWRAEDVFFRQSVTDFVVQPGGGVDVRLFDRLSLRAQADLRTIFGEEVSYQLRISGGASLHFGLDESAREPASRPTIELGVGYAATNDDPLGWLTNGWWVAPAVEIHPRVAIVGEYSRSSASYDQYVGAWMIGPELRFWRRERVAAFARFMVGSAERQYLFGDYFDKSRGLALQPGAGIDLEWTPYLRARFAVDYRYLFDELLIENTHQLRFGVGLLLRFR